MILTGDEACREWDNLIQNITGVIFGTDYNCQPSEVVYFDNFCWGCPDSPTPVPPAVCNYCVDTLKIQPTTNNVSIASGILNIAQSFSIAPSNISKVSAEIVYIKEDPIDTSCLKCITDEFSVWNFIPVNTTSWNTGPLLNGSPANSAGFYPSKRIIWFTNQQGTLDMKLKIALPGTINTSTCKLKGKVCIRFSFTDANCKTCEKIICYNYSN